MGDVWLAEQPPPLQREVAVKVIKAGMDTAQVIARFDAERQTLALLDHPGIATVFDGGSTDEGRPYFAMEYVKGEPITSYCNSHRLTVRQRVESLLQVCDAVEHAHQKGIIHRDLKPTNILMALIDGRPRPKIIDFGLAKATSPSLVAHTLYTEMGAFLGTPEYMSPEQADLGSVGIDTRTDVYAIGAVLYELLCGSRPFDLHNARQRGIDEIRRVLREEEPARPSDRAASSNDSQRLADDRHVEPRKLSNELQGDLDWITMKALEKDRARRYHSIAELAADLRRYLENRPVTARPPSVLYRSRKFARRHRMAVAVAATVLVAALGFVAAMIVQAARIAAERDRANVEADVAQQVSSFLINLFRRSDPSEARGSTITARTLLDEGAARVRSDLTAQPAVRARLMHTMGTVYDGLGLYQQAQELLTEALASRTQILGAAHPEVAETASALGNLYVRRGQHAAAEPLLKQALGIRQGQPAVTARELTAAQADLAVLYSETGNYSEAEAMYRDALALRERAGDAEGAARISINFAGLLARQRKAVEAEPLFRKALEIEERILGRNHPIVATVYSNLGVVLRQQKRFQEAAAAYATALDIRRQVLGPAHPSLTDTMQNLGNLELDLQHYDNAERYFRDALPILQKSVGDKHPSYARVLNNLGQLLTRTGRVDEAEAVLSQALSIREASLGADHPDVAGNLIDLATIQVKKGSAAAGPLFRRALAIRQRLYGDAHPATIEAANALNSFVESAHQPRRE